MLAILFAIKKWEAYLVNMHFIIQIDHQSLKYLLEQRLTTPSQQSWTAKLMQFDYEICFKQGKHNIAADALSRNPSFECNAIVSSVLPIKFLEAARQTWKKESDLKKLIEPKENDERTFPNLYRGGIGSFGAKEDW